MDLEILIARLTRTILSELQAEQQKETIVLFGKKEQLLPEDLAVVLGQKCRVLHVDDPWQPEEVDRFILPCLHIDQMVDLALGKGGSRLMYAVRQVLLTGRKVEVLQFEYRKYLETAPLNLINLYEDYKKQLEGFGLIDCIRPGKHGLRIKKKVLTEADILNAREQGTQQLEVTAGCHVTPLAQETARDLGINIRKHTGGIA